MTADGVDGRFYVEVVDGDVDAEAFAARDVSADAASRTRSALRRGLAAVDLST